MIKSINSFVNSQFEYLIEKITNAPFANKPFRHLTIANFFNPNHFNFIISDPQINCKKFKSNRDLIDGLISEGYQPQPFPGCVTDVDQYLRYLDNPSKNFSNMHIKGYGKDVIEGYGMTMRMNDIRSKFLKELDKFLNSERFLKALKTKFDIVEEVNVETAYQKNLSGYEISPHPDTRNKALTYMVNIYTDSSASKLDIHTRLMRFKGKYNYLYSYWEYNQDVDPRWVPWDWCEEILQTRINNSITIFRPSFDTLHAVKLEYNHCLMQRNQIYGNLWYQVDRGARGTELGDIDLHYSKTNEVSLRKTLKNKLRLLKRKFR